VDEQPPELAIFDFDGTLVRLATDYSSLRDRLERFAVDAGLDPEGLGLYGLSLRLESDPRTAPAIAAAELDGLRGGVEIRAGIELMQRLAEAGAEVIVVTHNGAEVIEEFFRSRGLPPPAAIFDRRALAAPKDESEAVAAYVGDRNPQSVLVVGDSLADRRLAERLGARFLAASEAWA
jgi:phosphoglycolate phosphatase-like HAD superfamily hydrolase